MANEDARRITRLLEDFVDNRDRSKEAAGELEVLLDQAYPDDEPAQDLVLALACYAPGGGAFLYDGGEVAKMCARLLRRLATAGPR